MAGGSLHLTGCIRLWLVCILAAPGTTQEPYPVAAAVAERLQQWGTAVTAVTAALPVAMPQVMVQVAAEPEVVELRAVMALTDTLEFSTGAPTNAWRT